MTHHRFHPDLPPEMTVAPGEPVTLDLRDGFDGQLGAGASSEDVLSLDPWRGHALEGPIAVEGAEPGDALDVTIVSLEPAAAGFTAIIPRVGVLGDEFDEPFLVVWDLRGGVARSPQLPGVTIPGRPFLGVLGVAPSSAPEDGLHTVPPREIGGNMDVRHLRPGCTVTLPVCVPGALCSAGDPHFAQGDGESCGTAIETSARVTLSFGIRKGAAPPAPTVQFVDDRAPGPCFATTGIGVDLDLRAAAQSALRGMLSYLTSERGLTREQAYVLVSVACDLQVSELVNAPNALVTAVLPLDVFDDERI